MIPVDTMGNQQPQQQQQQFVNPPAGYQYYIPSNAQQGYNSFMILFNNSIIQSHQLYQLIQILATINNHNNNSKHLNHSIFQLRLFRHHNLFLALSCTSIRTILSTTSICPTKQQQQQQQKMVDYHTLPW